MQSTFPEREAEKAAVAIHLFSRLLYRISEMEGNLNKAGLTQSS